METLEIQPKNFLVKWVKAPENCSINWQVKPLKRSINLSIYKRDDCTSSSNGMAVTEDSQNPDVSVGRKDSIISSSNTEIPTGFKRLRSSSIASVNQISESGFFKTKSRSSTFTSNLSNSDLTLIKDYHRLVSDELVSGTFETGEGGTFAFIFDNSFSKTTGKKVFFSTKIASGEAIAAQEVEKVKPEVTSRRVYNADESPESSTLNILRPKNGELMQGTLLKKRRKKLQGFTKRFFILNFKYGTLSYFKNNDNKLRGQMPIIESIVSANSRAREIFVDSGMEVWNLKALSQEDFEAWINAFNDIKKRKIVKQAKDSNFPESSHDARNPEIESIQAQIQSLLNDFQITSKQKLECELSNINSKLSEVLSRSGATDATSIFSEEYFDAHDGIGSEGTGVVFMNNEHQVEKNSYSDSDSLDDVQALVASSVSDSDFESNSDSDLEEVSAPSNVQKTLADPMKSDDLYPLPLRQIERDCDIQPSVNEPPSLLSLVRKNVGKDLTTMSMPVDMNEPITILQKYAELLEYSEIIDNALSGGYPAESGEFILRIAAFAVTYLSAMRVKVRSSRKPFNPLLGETYELVREDKGFRMLCEKVSHRPPVFALFAESKNWSLSFSPAPTQKFWGKTSEIYTSGTIKLTIKETGNVFSWSQPTCVLKNIIAGEKYMEPNSSVTIKCSSGQKAVVEFAKAGVFSGRSEDLTIKAFDSQKKELPYAVIGKWTQSMTLKTHTTEKLIWTVGNLLPNCEKKFGFPEFTGTLNKITSIEEGNLPPTDSRFRPDMREYSNGKIEEAEKLKKTLEEGQRQRRVDLEQSGRLHESLFFEHVGGDPANPESGEWVYRTGELGYWERRKTNNWDTVPELW